MQNVSAHYLDVSADGGKFELDCLTMDKKREIDKKRDSAFSIKLCDPDDETPIRELLSVGDSSYAITDKGIYQTRLADDIDPGRTNINVENTHQKILEHGFEHETVGRILFLALKLFDKNHLEQGFPCERAKLTAFEATKLLTEMQDIARATTGDIDIILNRGLLPDTGQSRNIPTTKNLRNRVKSFVHIADQVRDIIIALIKLIYGTGNTRKLLDEIEAAIIAKHGDDGGFATFFRTIRPMLVFTRNMRNAVEHPKNGQHFVILDFSPHADNTVCPPTVELLDAVTPQPKMLVTTFMDQMCSQFVDIVEMLILCLCLNNMGHFDGFEHAIMEMPLERRRHKATRFTYAVNLNGVWQPIG